MFEDSNNFIYDVVRKDLEEGQQVRLKYHPKYRKNARLIR